MTEDNGTKGPTGAPPSFIPASGRKRQSDSPLTGSSHRPNEADQPISFAPSSRHNRASTVETAKRASRNSPTSAPQSFTPTSASSERAHRRNQSPESFAPKASDRAISKVQQVRGSSSASISARGAAPHMSTSSIPMTASVTSARKAHIGRIVLIVFLVIVLALGIGIFAAWNWTDGQLNKQKWLTSKADTAGESWLILGSDEREGTIGDAGDVEGFRTDTILVLTKPKNGPSSLISIPRDSLVEIDGNYMKINAVAQLYSRKQLVNEVEDITGQKINHVAMVRFGGLVKVVDALGGIDLCYDQTVSDPYSGLNWTSGCHTVDGATALAFSRMRYADAQGDFGRAARQRQVINAIVKKGTSRQTLTNFGKTKKVAAAALDSVTVDEKTSTSSMLSMALAFKSASGKNGISGSVYWTDPDYYVDDVGSSVLLDNERNIQLFSELADGTHSPGTVGTLAESQQN